MGAGSDLSVTIDASLTSIVPVIEDMPRVAETWATWSEHSQLRFYLEWDELMERLAFLGELLHEGRMSTGQVERYRGVIAVLRDMTPVLARLELQHPTFAAAMPVEPRQR